jgi:hypothetical protein
MARAIKPTAENPWKPRPWDLLTAALAFAAILIASIAYFNSAQEASPQDDLEVVISGEPDIQFRKPRYVPLAEQTITLTNGGTRAAVLLSMELVVVDVMEDGTDCDNLGEKTLGAVFIPYDLEAVTLKAGEIVTRKVRLRKLPNKSDAFEPMFPDSKKVLRIIACYRFVAAVSGSREVTMIEAGTWTFNTDGTATIELGDMSEPHALLSQ